MLIFSYILEHKTEIFLVKRHFRFGKKQRKWKMNEGKIKTFWHVVENVKLRGNRHQTSSSSSNRNEWNPILGSPFLWMNQKQNTEFVKCFYIWLTCKLTNRCPHKNISCLETIPILYWEYYVLSSFGMIKSETSYWAFPFVNRRKNFNSTFSVKK